MLEIARSTVAGLPAPRYAVAGARALSVLGNGIVRTASLLELHDDGAGGGKVAGLLAAGPAPGGARAGVLRGLVVVPALRPAPDGPRA
jgi:hypothetical protein